MYAHSRTAAPRQIPCYKTYKTHRKNTHDNGLKIHD